MTAIVDSHCHLDFPQFRTDISDVIRRAEEANVIRMVTICTKPDRLRDSQQIADKFDAVCYAVGVHPHYAAKELAVTVDDLVGHARHPKMVAIGETGLDYHYTVETADAQKSSLAVHIEASRQTGLPLIIHSRDADDDIGDILSAEFRNGPSPASCTAFLPANAWPHLPWILASTFPCQESSPSRMQEHSVRFSGQCHWTEF